MVDLVHSYQSFMDPNDKKNTNGDDEYLEDEFENLTESDLEDFDGGDLDFSDDGKAIMDGNGRPLIRLQ